MLVPNSDVSFASPLVLISLLCLAILIPVCPAPSHPSFPAAFLPSVPSSSFIHLYFHLLTSRQEQGTWSKTDWVFCFELCNSLAVFVSVCDLITGHKVQSRRAS